MSGLPAPSSRPSMQTPVTSQNHPAQPFAGTSVENDFNIQWSLCRGRKPHPQVAAALFRLEQMKMLMGFIVKARGMVQVHPHELLVPTSSDCEVNLWLLTLAATLATRPAVADTSAPDATALDNTPMALARMMGPPPREVTPQPEEHRSLYGDEAMEAYMSGLEWTRDLWERARVVPGRTPLYDPGNSDPLFLEFHADTQRGWDQPQRHAQRQYRHEWECAERAARAQIAARRAAESQVAATTPRSASCDLACKDQGTVSSDSQPQVEQGSVAVGLDTADTQQQQQQATSSTSEDPSHAARCKQPGPCPQPKADAQPTKPAKKGSLASRFLGSTKRKACRLADKTGRFVTAAVDGIVDFVTAI